VSPHRGQPYHPGWAAAGLPGDPIFHGFIGTGGIIENVTLLHHPINGR